MKEKKSLNLDELSVYKENRLLQIICGSLFDIKK